MINPIIKQAGFEQWNRLLDTVYPITYLNCIVLKIHQNSRILNKSVFLNLYSWS